MHNYTCVCVCIRTILTTSFLGQLLSRTLCTHYFINSQQWPYEFRSSVCTSPAHPYYSLSVDLSFPSRHQSFLYTPWVLSMPQGLSSPISTRTQGIHGKPIKSQRVACPFRLPPAQELVHSRSDWITQGSHDKLTLRLETWYINRWVIHTFAHCVLLQTLVWLNLWYVS